MRVAASATECASVASVLRPCPVANTRVRADSLGGTSTTCSPSARSLFAMCLPMPWHPSIAHIRCGQRLASASIAVYPSASVAYRPRPATASSPAMTSIVAVRLCGSIPMTTWLSQSSCSTLLWLPGKGGGHRYFEQNKPLLSLSPLHGSTGPHRPKESHTTSVGSRIESDEPDT
jgi:hypothetical protein